METTKNIAQQLIKEEGISQNQLSPPINTPNSSLKEFEPDEVKEISLEQIERIAQAVGISPAGLELWINNAKIYTIIGGVNGAGKSSLVGALKEKTPGLGIIINVDALNVTYGSPTKGAKVAVQVIDECLHNGISFTQETTLSGRKTANTAKRAQEAGYHVRLYYVGLSTAEESLQRIRNRVKKGGHDIPDTDVLRRFSRRYDDILAVLPYCHEAVFYDNDNGFTVVANYRNGKLTRAGDNVPAWIIELEAALNGHK